MAFLNRLGYLERTGVITANHRTHLVRKVRRVLVEGRDLGWTAVGQPMEGLAPGFVLFRDDVPQPPLDDDRARDLPPAVLRTLLDQLPLLAARSGGHPTPHRDADGHRSATGRDLRPALQLRGSRRGREVGPGLDQLQRQPKQPQASDPRRHGRGGPRSASGRPRPLPAHPDGRLRLFPRAKTNIDGTEPVTDSTYSNLHRAWVRAIPAEHDVSETTADGTIQIGQAQFVDEAGQVLDPMVIKPYAYRHTYCQRHADNGTAPDVMRELMDHRSMATTQCYYRVREKRLTAAVDRVYQRQVDGRGSSIWPDTIRAIDAATRARMQIGQVSVPYGVCTEPSNVKAAGAACPYRFTCIACSTSGPTRPICPSCAPTTTDCWSPGNGSGPPSSWSRGPKKSPIQPMRRLRASLG